MKRIIWEVKITVNTLKVLVIFEGSLGKIKSTRGENDRMCVSILYFGGACKVIQSFSLYPETSFQDRGQHLEDSNIRVF